MRPRLPDQIRLAGVIDNHLIGLFDEPPITPSNIHHIVFIPFAPQCGATTLIQRLGGAQPRDPNPSAGVNGYRGVWSITQDKSGSILYRSLFLWDCSYDAVVSCKDIIDSYLQSANVVVLLIPKSSRNLMQNLIQWYQSNNLHSRRVVIVVTKSDLVGDSKITDVDIESLSMACNAKVVQSAISAPIDNVVLAINDNIPTIS
ncbi:hypothetical protein TVAG_063410 [Trichomonas vaginalis G3]|uniref:Small GTP-binding protein n=1 Tax=Trichomonas vaginalis (strain ATCC PRA-98 / G3) TaxID=412133 RepID=A2EU11_TRIV3|nr:P-loop containing nucleoside triphosphate hydrolases family [Trichomonas vaginalis G3]EAY03828.1 hypothetical protein TVAG_063410 [Trichomonas vaginalis G3]KAI5487514.1 P-loop containing nucleoside triphosphate hydrolases family [Trichomonas vaginalis G3]|eukprot:XP_001316051.1 hypothetical protein [Trichomonas vaginalis G3]